MNEPRWYDLPRILRRNVRAEVGDEIAFHIQMRTAELIEQGVEPARAKEMAEARFGPVPPIEQALVDSVNRRRHRADRAEANMELTRDLAFAVRSLRRAPAFTSASIATLALGVGATLAVFTVVNGVLLRPLPYDEPARIQMVWMANRTAGMESGELPLSSGFYSDIERQSRGFESIAAFRNWSYALSTPGDPDTEPLSGARVSPALFTVLGVKPELGQPFAKSDGVVGAPNVAMISHDLWQRRFGGDASIVGKPVMLNGATFTVSGVMPPGFAFPRGAELPAPFGFGLRTDVWTPLVFDSSDVRNYGTQNLSVIARVTADGSPLAAAADINGIMKEFLKINAPNLKLEYVVKSMADQASQRMERPLVILLGAVVLVLLIATANVASLLVARISARQRELAVRAALGAGRGRIARQLVTEHLVLAAAGTLIGLFIAYWTTKVMLAMVPGSLPRADDIVFDWRVLSFATLITLTVGFGFGLAATVAARWSHSAAMLHDGDLRSTGGLRRRYGRRLLAAAEVALSLMLLIGAALLTRSFISLQRVQLGFDANNVLTANVRVPVAGRLNPGRDAPHWIATFSQITARVSSLPGVTAAGMVSALPLSGIYEGGGLRIPGVNYENGQNPTAAYNVVAGDYFKAAGIKVVAGRAFDTSDDYPDRATMVINRELARQLFGSESAAVGSELRAMFEFNRERPPRTIVGVVDVVKQMSADESARPQVYVPLAQMGYPGLTLVVRLSGDVTRDTRSLVNMVKREMREVDPSATLNDARLWSDVVSNSMSRQRFNMTLIGGFAGLALVLAIVGLYGVLALLVGQRQREIGVRLALGAQRKAVVRMILGEGVAMAIAGVVLGVGGAFALTGLIKSMLFDVSTTDAWTFGGAVLLVMLVALGAAWVPARRASRVDPKTALLGD